MLGEKLPRKTASNMVNALLLRLFSVHFDRSWAMPRPISPSNLGRPARLSLVQDDSFESRLGSAHRAGSGAHEAAGFGLQERGSDCLSGCAFLVCCIVHVYCPAGADEHEKKRGRNSKL